jgi:alpha-beta hydrolase superfamily lysophospholipase
MYSSASSDISTFSEEAMVKDIVLDVTDIKRIGAKLGAQVTLLEIENAQHDIFLSRKDVREMAFNEMFVWLSKLESKMD